MKQLLFGDLELSAEKIYKYEDSIIGITNNIEVFSFKGVIDFTELELGEGQEFDMPEINEKDRILQLEQENKLLKAQNNALTERTDFHEEVLTEIILTITP
ncbi:hypothetical protein H9635_09990 [Solibacillus sp. A46]|uniref:Uncharacterized protein n=1 Tax=Solibacillus faecavium TaxID=2762221 RepID=A0ABR8XYS8_9BACL|nr:hypothetical protein [Solibacillus faecavium]MBD8037075.1 hypothetical protein [Solibacillus faecavium]